MDFQRIRQYRGSQHHAFEELICQLGRREVPARGGTFHRIEGAGGDGGVEAYWILANSSKVGFQAKFFLRSSDIDWSQIDASVARTLTIHPTVVRYVVALPCDLTERREAKGRGRTGWEQWSIHAARWKADAQSQLRHAVEFIPWTASEILDKLTAPSAAGLRAYWFGDVEFSADWFRNHVELAKAALDERYHPEDHVDVALQSLFEFISRHPAARIKLRSLIDGIKRQPIPELRIGRADPQPPGELVMAAKAAIDRLVACEEAFDTPSWSDWNADEWKRLAADAGETVDKLQRWAWSAESELQGKEGESGRQDLRIITRDLHKLSGAIDALLGLLQGKYLIAESERAALTAGRAGTGKSHLLARAADLAIEEARPAILLLGQQLREQPLWPQLAQRLDLPQASADTVLGALDAAAEAARVRGLILIDAINEGPGARLWRAEIGAFIAQVRRYPNLACVLSCRSEYMEYLIPRSVLEKIPRFEVRGFESPEEQESAARIYLDKRGIARPATPWLSPEFVNPLFLRSCCTALQQEGMTEFPRGLSGTKKILSFFVRSVARHLGVGRDGSDDLIGPTNATLREFAEQMARARRDHVPREQAHQIAAQKFKRFTVSQDLTWLEVLQRNGLLRFDPDPSSNPDDPLAELDEVVRFSFQRFQDHLIAEALLRAVDDIHAALADRGVLDFIRDGKNPAFEWQGLVEALSIQIPERFKAELIDALPGGVKKWWHFWQLLDAFAESIRWRDKGSFTDRTLQLFNRLFQHPVGNVNPFSLLIELSASQDHPWNAELIHRNLLQRKMPDRDAFWTTELNSTTDDDSHAIHRLIDWCLFGQTPRAERKTQWLCALVLTWTFTSSNRIIRDRATKALTAVLLARSDLLPDHVTEFSKVDDLYVLERLWAAAYGAACIDPVRERVKEYAMVAATSVFGGKTPPPNILLRDYARGLIDLASSKVALPTKIDVRKCRPPYGSLSPRFRVTEEGIKKVAERAGDNSILRSCGDFHDFGVYEIKSSVSRFTAVPLSKPEPYSQRELYNKFENEVIDISAKRQHAFKVLTDARYRNNQIIRIDNAKSPAAPNEVDVARWAAQVEDAQRALLLLLSNEERARYKNEAVPWLFEERTKGHRKRDPKSIDIAAARRWVAKRAYDFGWTKKRFAHESVRHRDYSRERPLIERVGKKYQWLALDELLCRLSDNYWIGGLFGRDTRRYDTPLDVGFLRDIDPTIIPRIDDANPSQGPREQWVRGPDINMEVANENELSRWPFLSDPGQLLSTLPNRADGEGRRWITLYEHRHATLKYEPEHVGEHGMRQQEFRLLACAIVKKGQDATLARHLSKKREIDFSHWDPVDFVDGPFLLEAPWRNTWKQVQWTFDEWYTPKDVGVAFPLCEYRWESHLDASLPEGCRAYIPMPWLTHQMGLLPHMRDASAYVDSSGTIRFLGSHLSDDGLSALIDAEQFERFLEAQSLACIWVFIAERNAWPGGSNSLASWRRSEGVAWNEGGQIKTIHWKKDTDLSNRSSSG